MKVKCEKPFDELAVQVLVIVRPPKILHIVYKQDRQTDRQTIQTLDAPADLSGQGHKNIKNEIY